MPEKKLKKSELLNILSKGWDLRRAKIAAQREKANKWTQEWSLREKALKKFLEVNPELVTLLKISVDKKRQTHFIKSKNLEKKPEKIKNQDES